MGAKAFLTALALVGLVAAGCSKPTQTNGADSSAATGKLRDAPDFGGVKKEYVEVEGVGPSRAAAVDDALRMAVKQVNGVSVDASEAKLDVATSISTSMGDVDIASSTFAKAVETRSNGQITDFKVLKEKKATQGFMGLGGGKGQRETWQVRIGANIAKYKASAEANRPRLIVAVPRTAASAFAFGDGDRSAEAVRAGVRGRITNALAQTNRFAVLDREFTSEIQSEMDLIGSGAVNREDTARLGQMLAADLIVVPTIERMEYVRHARQLRLADRELVSYSGGARISFRVLNATTGQMVMSDTFATDFPTTTPTTLGAHVDADGAAEKAMNELTQKFVSRLLQKTFPVSVISLSGQDVILSQGGAAVRQGARYRAVILGDELKDPQTGQSLGRVERAFGTVFVTRSEPNAAYGALEGAPALSAGQFRPGLLEIRDEVSGAAMQPATPAVAPQPGAAPAQAATAPSHRAPKAVKTASRSASTAGADKDQNW